MLRAISIALIAVAALGATVLGPSTASAASSIRVKVDDQPITSYDIQQRARLLQLVGLKGGEKVATEELVDETLQFIEGAKRSMTVSDARVNGAIAQIGQGMKMSPEQLAKALSGQGVDIATLKRRIKAAMLWQQLVQGKMRFEGKTVKAEDVTAALLGSGDKKITTSEYTLQQITFVVPSGSSAAYTTQRRREAEAFRGRFTGCDNSVEQAKQLKGVVVRNIGRRNTQDIDGGPEGKEILSTPAGKTTHPLPAAQGVDLIAVCSIRELNSDAAVRSDVETKLLLERNKDLGKDYMAELRKKAIIEYR
jgi:peptidyl-prolyl cis-trans isomerase SurA